MHIRVLHIIIITSLLLATGCSRSGKEEASANADTARKEGSELRIISLGGGVTETVYALGFGDRVVATDVSSTWPAAATKLPQVGYQRTLSAENILALNPTLVIGSTESGPPEAIQQLRLAGVDVVIVPAVPSLSGIREKITAIAAALGAKERGEVLADSIGRELAGRDTIPNVSAPRVMFIYSRGNGSTHVSGKGTSADLMIRLAGGKNAVTEYDGFRPVTSEGIVAAAPEIILLPTGGMKSLGGIEGVLKIPGIAETPAGRARRIVQMDDLYLLGLGPRTHQAVIDLAKELQNALGGSGTKGGPNA